MTEIRPIRDTEAEPFLQLLCDVFELDFHRAHGIFFNEPLFDLKRKWALFDDSEMVSILTTVPLQFGWGHAIGIAGVATRRDRQREGLAGSLIHRVLEESAAMGEGSAYLFAKDATLYSRLGFETVDHVVRAAIDAEPERGMTSMFTTEEVEAFYNEWAEAHPNRLRRDARRWKYWKWNLRVCTPLAGGYLCHEGHTIRECIVRESIPQWRLPADSEWFGTQSMANQIQIPLIDPRTELFLMAHQAPKEPQMFMTDQF